MTVMAHNWKLLDIDHRQCRNCGKTQYRWQQRDMFERLSYHWQPRVGRCTGSGDGRPAKRGQAILAAKEEESA